MVQTSTDSLSSTRSARYISLGPGGQEWWIERSNGFSDPKRLVAGVPDRCADTKVVYDDNLFYSAIVSAGRLGVIYSMVLELEPEYWPEERGVKEDFAVIQETLKLSAKFGFDSQVGILMVRNNGQPGLRFLQLVFNANDLSSCWVQERRLHTGPRTEADEVQPTKTDLSFCSPLQVGVLAALLTPAALTALFGPDVALAIGPPIASLVAVGLLTRTTVAEVFLDVLGAVPELVPPITDLFLGGLVGTRVGPSRTVLDQMDYTRPPSCYSGDSGDFSSAHSRPAISTSSTK